MDVLLPVTGGFLFVLAFTSALAAYSLRDFSRSRLAAICRKKGRQERFSTILKRHEDALLAVDLVFIISMSLCAVTILVWLRPQTGDLEESSGWIARSIEVAVLVTALLAASVVLPWTFARVTGEMFLFRVWPLLAALLELSAPFIALLHRLDRLAHRLFGLREPSNGDAEVITEEIRTVVDEGQREGILESEARTMIHRVMELQDVDAAAIMTPRTDMVCISSEATLDEAKQCLLEAGHSRIPVIGSSTDDIVGILYAKDLLRHIDTGNGHTTSLKEIVREPFYVPETTGIDKLLETMKRQRVHMAIVIDEYSGVSGLVTMEDILEEIVGEIVDEYDAAEDAGIHPVGPGVVDVDSRVHIDDLNEQFAFNLPENGDYDTIGGFVLNELGRIPAARESITWQNLRITVLDAGKRKIHRLRIEADETLAAKAAEDA